jgi:prephenate dehydratase
MTVAYSGGPGAFSHEASRAFLPGEEPIAYPSFARVIEAIERGEADLGILPIENNNVGRVEEVRQLLASSRVKVLAEHRLPIRIHLLGRPGSSLDQVRTVVSHPMALKQCAATMARLGLAMKDAPSTSVAAKELLDPANAVLASEAAAAADGLVILKRDVHDREVNETTFVVISRVRE